MLACIRSIVIVSDASVVVKRMSIDAVGVVVASVVFVVVVVVVVVVVIVVIVVGVVSVSAHGRVASIVRCICAIRERLQILGCVCSTNDSRHFDCATKIHIHTIPTHTHSSSSNAQVNVACVCCHYK